MSRNEPQSDTELTEADYLAREVADAKAALVHALHGLKGGMASSTDMRKWVEHYPWAALGAAAAAGFAAAAAVTPAHGESLQEKASRLMPKHEEPKPSDGDGATSRAAMPSRMSAISDRLINSLFDIAKILVQTLIVTTLRGPEPQESSPYAAPEQRMTRMAK